MCKSREHEITLPVWRTLCGSRYLEGGTEPSVKDEAAGKEAGDRSGVPSCRV